jgi:uncharacterized SAM-binding protein YcdF (DUF218 family)
VTRREQAAFGAALGLVAGFITRDLDLLSLVSLWGDRLFLVPLGFLIGPLCMTTRLRGLFVATTLGLAALWVAATCTPLSSMLLDGLVRKDLLRPADAVLVLNSRMQTDGDPTSTQLSRLFHGLELVKDGLAPRLMITEVPPPYATQRPFAQKMLSRFRPEVELIVLQPVWNTHDEALLAADYLKARGLKTIIVATSPTHTFRSAAVLEQLGLEVMAAPALETDFDLENLDWPSDRLMSFGTIMHERLGIFVYRRRGWIR